MAPLERDELAQLVESIDNLVDEIAALKDETNRENIARDKRIGRSHGISIFAVVVGAVAFLAGAAFGSIGIVLAADANDAAEKAQTAIEAADTNRDEARVNTCHTENDNVVREHAALDAIEQALPDGLRAVFNFLLADDDPPPTAEELAQLELLLDNYAETVNAPLEATRPLFRDCTPAGIEAYFAGTGGYLEPGERPDS